MSTIHTILHPTDFSEYSMAAFHIARDLARQNRAVILLLHVAESPGPEQISYGEAAARPQPEAYFQRLLVEMRSLFKPLGSEVPLQYLIVEGHPATEIERVARDRHCDLIVLGTNGRSPLQRMLLGSTSSHLLHRAHCPVLIVGLPVTAIHSDGESSRLMEEPE
jgi:nucleotide-binding universal stress UspA family protein